MRLLSAFPISGRPGIQRTCVSYPRVEANYAKREVSGRAIGYLQCSHFIKSKLRSHSPAYGDVVILKRERRCYAEADLASV